MLKLRVFAVAAVVLASVASAANTPWTTDTLWDMRSAGDPQITKDGKSVIFTLGWNDRMNDAAYSNLWIVSSDGKDQRPLTTGAFRDSSPRLSPDNTRLAYFSNRSGGPPNPRAW